MRVTGTTFVVVPKGIIRVLGEQTRAFSSIAGFGDDAESNITGSDKPERAFGATVTVNALDTLGIHLALGNFFSKDDEVFGQDHDVILSYGYWQRHFGSSPSALGRTLRIDGISRRALSACYPPVCASRTQILNSSSPRRTTDPTSTIRGMPSLFTSSAVSQRA